MYTWKTLVREVAIFLLAALWWVPFYILVVVALKPPATSLSSPFTPPMAPDLQNFASAWAGTGGVGMLPALIDSAVITVGSVVLLVLIGSATAYTVARERRRIGDLLYLAFTIGIIVPTQLGIVPMYSAMRAIGLLGSVGGAILLYAGLFMPLAIFLYTGFVRALPSDYEEAAFIDGANKIQAFGRIVFPLLAPITGTVAVLCSLIIWNDFFTQLVFFGGGTNNRTVPVEIYSFVGQYETQWNVVFAAVAISLAPIMAFYLFAQRRLMRGFTGGLKV